MEGGLLRKTKDAYHSGNPRVLRGSMPGTEGRGQFKKKKNCTKTSEFYATYDKKSLEFKCGSGSIRKKLRSGARICPQSSILLHAPFPLPPKRDCTQKVGSRGPVSVFLKQSIARDSPGPAQRCLTLRGSHSLDWVGWQPHVPALHSLTCFLCPCFLVPCGMPWTGEFATKAPLGC